MPAGGGRGEDDEGGQRALVVLVVDDSPQIRQLIGVNLQLEGFVVVEAADGVEALEILQTLRPDVMTIDARMPRLDGFGTVARLRADPRTASLPVVMVTASTQASDRTQAQVAAVDVFLEKPFDPARLVAEVRRLVGEADAAT